MQIYTNCGPNQSQALLGQTSLGRTPAFLSKIIFSCRFQDGYREFSFEIVSPCKLTASKLNAWVELCWREFKNKLLNIPGLLIEIERDISVTKYPDASKIGSVYGDIELIFFNSKTIVARSIVSIC